jgi:hypothetical protein
MKARAHVLLAILAALALGLASAARAAAAEAQWELEPVRPPTQAGESEQEHDGRLPIGLGRVGDIEFFAPNRGLLITAGNGASVKPSVWAYNGKKWFEISEACGATDGRIAWEGPNEFWTVSDGRRGQAASETHGEPPLEDNTLCHFGAPQGKLEVVGSYASLAFRPESYQAMHGAACLGTGDCWFGGELLPSGEAGARTQPGAFQLHWNGSSLTAEPYPAEHPIEDMRRFGRYAYESVQIEQGEQLAEGESPSDPSDLHLITPIGVQPTFISLTTGFPTYAPGERPAALEYLRLGADEEALWGAANPVSPTPEGSAPGQVTILRYAGGQWSQVLGFGTDPAGGNPFTREGREAGENETVAAIAAEPGTADAWVALTSPENEFAAHKGVADAMVAQISPNGQVSEQQTLPDKGAPRGAAAKIACPATNDCWLVTTEGWLFHLTTPAGRRAEEAGPSSLYPESSPPITFRPEDQGIPQTVPDAPPPEESGLLGAPPPVSAFTVTSAPPSELRIPVALLSKLHARLVRGTTLELSFHLAAKARVQLIAQRKKRVVAKTPMQTFGAGNRKLLLRLNRRAWPTKLSLQTHALAPLPTTSTRSPSVNTVTTGLRALPQTPTFAEAGILP